MRLRRRAVEAELLAERDAEAAAGLARSVLHENAGRDHHVSSTGHRVCAIGALRRGDTRSATEHVEAAVACAEAAGEPVLLGKALMTAMGVAASVGDPEGALELADRAEPLLGGDLGVRLAIQRGSVLVAGFSAVDEAIAVFDRVLREHAEIQPFELGILHLNRGGELLRRGDLSAASSDFDMAHAAFLDAGNRPMATASMLHRAIAAARMGDLPTVFSVHRELVETDALSTTDPHDHLDLAQSLVISGLLAEASALVQKAMRLVGAADVSELSVQIELLAARIDGLRGVPTSWERVIRTAEQLDSPAVTALVTVQRASLCDDEVDVDSLRDAADVLRRTGHLRDALEAEIAALQRVRPARSPHRRNVGDLPQLSPGATPFDRARLRHLRALHLRLAGDSARARSELARGIGDVESARVAIAASDLRAAASDRAPAMAELGLRLALESGRPRPVLEWSERVRSAALRLASTAVHDEADLRIQLDELRELHAGEPSQAADLERRLTIRRRTQRADRTVVRSRNAGEICDTLGHRYTLLEYIELDGRLMVLLVDRRRASLVDLDITVDDVETALGKLLFGLRRMATRTGPAADAAAEMVDQIGERLGRQLLPDRRLHGEQLVIVPTGPLHHLPWAALPPIGSREFVVAPSAHVWCETQVRDRRGDGVLTVVGPGLDAADDEALAVARAWRSRRRPVRGTAPLMRRRLPGTAVAHVCCHGRFRTDSPQFSALQLDDGPFTVFDLEGIDDLPSIVVLSACSLGSVDVHLGDDLLGFPAALFARGVSTLIAAVLPVEDGATHELMVHFHERLAGGEGVSAALRHARQEAIGRGGPHAAAAAGFLCFGAG